MYLVVAQRYMCIVVYNNNMSVRPITSFAACNSRDTMHVKKTRNGDVLEEMEQRLRDKIGQKIRMLRLQVQPASQHTTLFTDDMPIIGQRTGQPQTPVCLLTATASSRRESYQSVMMTSNPFTRCFHSSWNIANQADFNNTSSQLVTTAPPSLTRTSSYTELMKQTMSRKSESLPAPIVTKILPVITSPLSVDSGKQSEQDLLCQSTENLHLASSRSDVCKNASYRKKDSDENNVNTHSEFNRLNADTDAADDKSQSRDTHKFTGK